MPARKPLHQVNSQPTQGPQAILGRKTGLKFHAFAAEDDWFKSDNDDDTNTVKEFKTVKEVQKQAVKPVIVKRRWMPKIVARRHVEEEESSDVDELENSHEGYVTSGPEDSSFDQQQQPKDTRKSKTLVVEKPQTLVNQATVNESRRESHFKESMDISMTESHANVSIMSGPNTTMIAPMDMSTDEYDADMSAETDANTSTLTTINESSSRNLNQLSVVSGTEYLSKSMDVSMSSARISSIRRPSVVPAQVFYDSSMSSSDHNTSKHDNNSRLSILSSINGSSLMEDKFMISNYPRYSLAPADIPRFQENNKRKSVRNASDDNADTSVEMNESIISIAPRSSLAPDIPKFQENSKRKSVRISLDDQENTSALFKESTISKSRRRSSIKPAQASVASDVEDYCGAGAYDVPEESYMSEPEVSLKGHKIASTAVKRRWKKNPMLHNNLKIYTSGGLQETIRDDGVHVKRSKRVKYKPLEYWRNERVVFGRRKSGPFPVPVIQDIIRVPDEQSSQQKSRKKVKVDVQKNRKSILAKSSVSLSGPDKKDVDVTVFAPVPVVNEELVTIRDSEYLLCKSLSDPYSGTYAGTMCLPKNTLKPARSGGKITTFGTITAGQVDVTIADRKHTLTEGCSFLVPRGTNYEFQNTTSREARISYVNVRD